MYKNLKIFVHEMQSCSRNSVEILTLRFSINTSPGKPREESRFSTQL